MANDTKKAQGGPKGADGEAPAGRQPAQLKKEDIIRSRKFSAYHQDMLRALLPNERYSMEEADRIVGGYFNEGGK